MQAEYACKGLFLAGYAMSINSGVAVEFGSWVGQSSSCLAAGMKSAGLSGKLHCFDIFDKDYGKNNHKLSQKFKHMKLLDIFHIIVDRIDSNVNVHPGFIGTADVSGANAWNNMNVGIFAIDSAKQLKATISQTNHGIWQKLKPGGILFLMDFSKVIHQIMIFYTMYVLNGDLEVEYIAFESAPWGFSIKHELDREKLIQWKTFVFNDENKPKLLLVHPHHPYHYPYIAPV
jgi:hypothetical protein